MVICLDSYFQLTRLSSDYIYHIFVVYRLKVVEMFKHAYSSYMVRKLNLKVPITTAADDKFCNISLNLKKKIRNDIS